ncbi:MAG TPA: YggS family pyridoxal phosphate-dependent enzyme [Chitinophagaceae bacterium]|jgi:hypothetical protein|nr:YggS family pyridoxal phosphate-dependent enzyme [Chitinophagaceae bacterium]
MAVNKEAYLELKERLDRNGVTLVAVSKTKPVSDIRELYDLGQRDFGENYVQELVEKAGQLPQDIRWHFIGHLQTNKVKYIIPFVHLIHGADSLKLLTEINRQAAKHDKVQDVLLQVHIAREETKFGMDVAEAEAFLRTGALTNLRNIALKGLMGMASFSEDTEQVRTEFSTLRKLYTGLQQDASLSYPLQVLSMGMSGDYGLALEEGSSLVRIGSLLFGARTYPPA